MTRITDPTSVLNEALARHEAGELAAAMDVYRNILAQRPDHPRALRYLGLALFQSGEKNEGQEMLERAVALAPSDAKALNDLGRILALGGDPQKAKAFFEQAVAADPAYADAWHNLGAAAREAGDISRAFDAFKTALRQDPHRALTFSALGDLLVTTNQSDEAVQCWRHAAQIDRTNPEIPTRIGLNLSERGKLADAVAAFEDAVKIDPSYPEAWVGLGSAKEDLGDRAAAIQSYEKAIQVAPGQGVAISRLLVLRADDAEPWLVERAEWALAADEVPDEARALVGYGLGKAREKTGDYRGAFTAWNVANAARRRSAGPLDREALTRRVDTLMATFDVPFFATRSGYGLRDHRPVFVVGMPRSGTTLTEQIIGAHAAAGGAGELSDIARLIDEIAYFAGTAVAWPEVARNLSEEAAREMAQDYLTVLAATGGADKDRIVDKAPMNFFALGLIALLFPAAHVVWCRRDPRDVCLSIYGENFAASQHYATNLADLAFYFREHERLMDYWGAVLPLPIHEHVYERVVADPEGETRRLLAFLGLDWDAACLDFHTRDSVVQTPSRWQVRQPVYASSAGRWRRFRAYLAPLLDEFGAD